MNYKIAHVNWMEMGDSILVTNDIGKYCLLSRKEFDDFIQGKINNEIELYRVLCEKGFIYEDTESFLQLQMDDMTNMKRCLLSGTQLFILVLTDSCNQRCIYCQAGRAHASKTSIEICRKAVDIAVQSPVARATIEFQGGEPTLNPDALYFTIPYAKKVFQDKGKRVDFSIVSNLTATEPKLLKWLIEQDVHISTSLDGPRIVQEYNRPLASKGSSYDTWCKGVRLYKDFCVESGKIPCISAIETTTRKSLAYPCEIVDEYLENHINRLYIRPLTPLGSALERWEEIGYDPKEYVEFYCRVLTYMMELNTKGVDVSEETASLFLARILYGDSVGHTEFRSPCGAGVGQIAINYDGNIYTCDEGRMIANMGDQIFKMGTVDNSYQELLRSPTVHAVCSASCIEGLPFCSDCAYMPFCAVCPVVNYGIEGDLISRNEQSYRCVIAKGILNYLFQIIRNNDSTQMEILRKWANR